MKRVRKCSKKRELEESDRKDPFTILHLDLIVEILFKLPARSIAWLIFVSKLGSSIIRGKDFIKSYLNRSSTRPRLLFVVFAYYTKEQFIQSCSQEDPSSDHHRLNITPDRRNLYGFSPPVRGLICRQIDTKVMIGNPSTGQFLTLPRVRSTRRGLYSFFGYDPVNDVYKILCMTVLQGSQRRESQVVSEEHQVFTLGPKQRWRSIVCKHPHLPPPFTRGICINGVVYYYAWIRSEGSLISFDLISEEFNVIECKHPHLPLLKTRGICINGVVYYHARIRSEGLLISFDLISEEFNVIQPPADCWFQNLVNYNGKIALTSATQFDNIFRLWVLKDACSGKKWYRSSLAISSRSWSKLAGVVSFELRGTLSTGELIFAPLSPINPVHLISFDPKINKAKKVVVEGL
ncbi:PREDICTED: F-box/kelch-repeat protein At3g04660-like [Camelina sativa]|uniref:F-box/kelch-repeat protein At3g04660-like n=1 Tax=Camelina sativa TaxID=90675 RepID=A0ABM0XGZ5_CAMSA|nr:PREDICTED: F-box/kelch-repeat protein At3g04660-like [Camelina sativa]